MRLADEIQELFEEAMREVDRLSLNAVRAAAFGVGHWLAGLWPRMPCEGWQDELDWLLREYARNHLFITDQSRADIIAWVTAANEEAKRDSLLPGGAGPRLVDICYGPRPQPAALRTAHDKPAPIDPDHPALRRVGHIIMEQFPPADWLRLATSSLKRHSVPEETAKQFLQWLEAEQRRRVGHGAPPSVGADTNPPAVAQAAQPASELHRAAESLEGSAAIAPAARRGEGTIDVAPVAGNAPAAVTGRNPVPVQQQAPAQQPSVAIAGPGDFKWQAHKLQWTDFKHLVNQPGNPRLAVTNTIIDLNPKTLTFKSTVERGQDVEKPQRGVRLIGVTGVENPAATLNVVKQRLQFPVVVGKDNATSSWVAVKFNPASVKGSINALFNSQTSYINTGNQYYQKLTTDPKFKDAALAHEQNHLDIAELFARSLISEFSSYVSVVRIDTAKPNGAELATRKAETMLVAFAVGRFTKLFADYQKVHGGFDLAIGGFSNPKPRQLWSDKIQALLNKGVTKNPNDIAPWLLLRR